MTDTKPQPAQTEFTAAGGAAFDAFRRSGGLTLAERWNSIAAAALSAAPVEYQWGVRWNDADGDPKPVEGEDRLDGYGPHWTKWRRTVGPWEEVHE